jgi:hypothetical protein
MEPRLSENESPDHPQPVENHEPTIPTLHTKDERNNQVEACGDVPEATETKASNEGTRFQAFMHRHFPDAKPHDRWTLVFTGVIAVSTVLYTLVAGFTLYEIWDSSKDTHNLAVAAATQASQTEEIAQAAQDQVDAANEISDAADSFSETADRIDGKIGASEDDFRRMASASDHSLRTVSQTDQRAWVGVTGMKGITLPPSPEALAKTLSKQGYLDLSYSFTIENSGKTPARYMKVRTTYSLGVEPLAWPNPGQVEDAGFLQVIFPGKTEENLSTHPVRLPLEDVMGWQLGREYVYVYVVIEYNDIFPNTKVHHTWLCSKFGAFGQQTFCHTGNDAD